MKWHRITISTKDESRFGELATTLEAKFKKAKKPKDMMVFADSNSPSDLHWVVLSPACTKYAKDILDEYSAELCDKPNIASLTHFAGNFDEDVFVTL